MKNFSLGRTWIRINKKQIRISGEIVSSLFSDDLWQIQLITSFALDDMGVEVASLTSAFPGIEPPRSGSDVRVGDEQLSLLVRNLLDAP